MTLQLLKKQHKDVLEYICAELDRSNHPPPVRDIAKKFHVSRQRAHQILKQLQSRKMVDWKMGDINTLEITDKGNNVLKDWRRNTKAERIPSGSNPEANLSADCLACKETSHLSFLLSENYTLTEPLKVFIESYADGTVIVESPELNIYAEGDSDHEAMRKFSGVLIEHFELLEGLLKDGKKLGRDLKIQYSILKRLIRRLES